MYKINRILATFRIPYIPRWAVLLLDMAISGFAFVLSYIFCYELMESNIVLSGFLVKFALNLFIFTCFFLVFKTYSGIIRLSTFTDAWRIFLAVTCSTIVLYIINWILIQFGKIIFINVGFLINASLTFALMFCVRMFVKMVYDYINVKSLSVYKEPVFVYGVNPTTLALAKAIRSNPSTLHVVKGFICYDKENEGKRIFDIPLYKKDNFVKVIKSKGIKTILIANETSVDEKEFVMDLCHKYNLRAIVIPPISQWEKGKPKNEDMKDIQIEDLLGRNTIDISVNNIKKALENECVLITGAAGSIGSEIVRQVINFNPKLLILCDSAETPLHNLSLELEGKNAAKFITYICDVRNKLRMSEIMRKHRPHYVFHAAAYKHVPLMEHNPWEAIHTNVIGTKNMANLSVEYGVDTFVMISTDKAVNPTNVMGASKRIAEIYTQTLNKQLTKAGESNHTKFITTRFGNVLGSNGSVVPRFKEQITKGGPVTVTHPDIIRYFMTIPEACRLVLEAGVTGTGGEIYIFDMGKPVKIVDLAERMIKLAGFTPGKDIQVEFTGLRPGEKLYEELLNDEEFTKPTHHEKIMIAKVRDYDYDDVNEKIENLTSKAYDFSVCELVEAMKILVPEFESTNPNFQKK